MTISPETIDHAAKRLDSESEERAHTDWVRENVAESLADPRPNIPNEQAMTELQAVIDAARKNVRSKPRLESEAAELPNRSA